MAAKKKMITVKIFGAPSLASGWCPPGTSSAGCGPTLSNGDIANEVEKELDVFFPGQVKVDYFDLFADDHQDCQRIMYLISRQNLPLPLITINDVPVIAGAIDLETLVQKIKAVQANP